MSVFHANIIREKREVQALLASEIIAKFVLKL